MPVTRSNAGAQPGPSAQPGARRTATTAADRAAHQKKKKELQDRIAKAPDADKQTLQDELDGMEGIEGEGKTEEETAKNQAEEEKARNLAEAAANEEKARNEAEAAKWAREREEREKNAAPSIEEILSALVKGLTIGPLLVDTNKASGVGLRATESIIGYKNDNGGDVALVVDFEFPHALIYRLKRNVIVPEDTPNIVDSRRITKVKSTKPRMHWSKLDISGIQGVGLDIPAGYKGHPEELAIARGTRAERKAMRAENKKPEDQPELQLNVVWKEVWNGSYTSWENRSSFANLYSEDIVENMIFTAAQTQEKMYRDAGGQHGIDGPVLIKRPERAGKQPEEVKLEKLEKPEEKLEKPEEKFEKPEEKLEKPEEKLEKPEEEKPEEKQAAVRASARAAYKIDWCGDHNIDPNKWTPVQEGKFGSAFDAYWKESSSK